MFLKIFRDNFCVQDTKFVSATQFVRAWQNESTFGKHDHVSNVAATMCPRFAGPLGSGSELSLQSGWRLLGRRKNLAKQMPHFFFCATSRIVVRFWIDVSFGRSLRATRWPNGRDMLRQVHVASVWPGLKKHTPAGVRSEVLAYVELTRAVVARSTRQRAGPALVCRSVTTARRSRRETWGCRQASAPPGGGRLPCGPLQTQRRASAVAGCREELVKCGASNTAERPSDQSMDQPSARVTNRAPERPTDGPTERPSDQLSARATNRWTNRAPEWPIEGPTERQSD